MTRPASDTLARPPFRPPAPGPGLEQDAWGAVFCGGASRRMGRDKARLELAGETLVQRAARVLGGVLPRVLLASGSEPRYAELGLECVLDGEAQAGPLAGLAAALERLEREQADWLCVLACDMPRVEGDVFRRLLARARAGGLQVVLVATAGGLEPLCGVYHRTALPAVRAALARGERRMDSIHRALRVATVPEVELGRGCASNLNTRADFLAAGGRWA